jgi:hypothetical protein
VPLLLVGLAWCIASRQNSYAEELTQPTVDAFAHYVQLTEVRIQNEVSNPKQFLYIDSLPEKERNAAQARLLGGQVIIEPMVTRENAKIIDIPYGMVHHWMAIGFLPGATRDQAMALAQNFGRYAELYAPDVQRVEILSRRDQRFEVSYRLYRRAIVTVVYNTRFGVDFFALDASRGYAVSRSIRIAEVENPDRGSEREFPVGNDHGYMWRLNLYTRYLERDNGVYIQIEFLSLSRSVPTIFAWLVNPYIRSVPKDYLTDYIVTTQKALQLPHQSRGPFIPRKPLFVWNRWANSWPGTRRSLDFSSS